MFLLIDSIQLLFLNTCNLLWRLWTFTHHRFSPLHVLFAWCLCCFDSFEWLFYIRTKQNYVVTVSSVKVSVGSSVLCSVGQNETSGDVILDSGRWWWTFYWANNQFIAPEYNQTIPADIVRLLTQIIDLINTHCCCCIHEFIKLNSCWSHWAEQISDRSRIVLHFHVKWVY